MGFGGYEHIPESERAREASPGEVTREPKNVATEADTPSLKLGETLSFASLGPIIINTDGTTRRIANWDTMSDKEQAVALRRIGKRNQERIAELKRLDAEGAAGDMVMFRQELENCDRLVSMAMI